MKDLTFILPIHEYSEQVAEYLKNVFTSLSLVENADDSTVIVVGPKQVANDTKSVYEASGCKQQLKVVENDNIDVYSQINAGVLKCVTKYFSVFEYDDAYTRQFVNNVQKELKDKPELSVLLPLNHMYTDDGKMVAFGNEIVLSSSFGNEDNLGYLDFDALNTYMDFNVTGGVIKTEDFIACGMLKPSMKIASWYELLLRLCIKNKKIYVMPKVGYLHTVGRKGSYMEETATSVTQEEGMWLIKTAQEECFFDKDRNKTFEEARLEAMNDDDDLIKINDGEEVK